MKNFYKDVLKHIEEPVEIREGHDLIKECVKYAREKDKTKYNTENIASALYCSKSTFEQIKSGKRNISEEEKKRLVEYLEVSLKDIDPSVNAYYRYCYKEMFGVEPEDMAWVDSYEKHLEDLEYAEADKALKKQIEKIERWFTEMKVKCHLSLNDRYRLANYIGCYQNIEDFIYMFYLYYSTLNEKEKILINELMSQYSVHIEKAFASREIFEQLALYEKMVNLSEDRISAGVENDRAVLYKDKNIRAYAPIKQDDCLTKQYLETLRRNWNTEVMSYASTERLYQRFWSYVVMTSEDWKTLTRFKLLELADTYESGSTPQQSIYQMVQIIYQKQVEIEKVGSSECGVTEDKDLKDAFIMTKDFCILPLELAEEAED